MFHQMSVLLRAGTVSLPSVGNGPFFMLPAFSRSLHLPGNTEAFSVVEKTGGGNLRLLLLKMRCLQPCCLSPLGWNKWCPDSRSRGKARFVGGRWGVSAGGSLFSESAQGQCCSLLWERGEERTASFCQCRLVGQALIQTECWWIKKERGKSFFGVL